MNSQELQIIIASEAMPLGSFDEMNEIKIDYLDLEWYELNTAKLKRKTQDGLEVQVKKSSNHIYKDKDIIYLDSQKVIQIRLKSCDCIVFTSQNMNEIGEVAFVIGNEHLPIFLNSEKEMLLAYDGRIYQLLLSLNFVFRIESRFLHPQEMLKVSRNYNQ